MSAQKPPRRPYFLRAVHEWIGDAGMTPQIIVDAAAEGLDVPPGYERDGKIVLNISSHAVQDLCLGNDAVDFTARFSGVSRPVHVPMFAVLGIYARESGEGLAFGGEEEPSPAPQGPDEGGGKRAHLKVVK